MEGRMRRYGGQLSPEKSKPWVEPPPPPPPPMKQGRKIPVVYYLSRNHQLDHPHFIEVPISSPDGLYLRDVIGRLNALRGKKMPGMYSWSYKRSYKNGFVWHDLSEDDLIHPAHCNEYVLKGSELLDRSPSDRIHHSNNNPQKHHSSKHPEPEPEPEPVASSRTQETSSSSSSPQLVLREAKSPPQRPSPLLQDEERAGSSGNISPEPILVRQHRNWETGSPSSAEYRVCLASGAVDASTQTDDGEGRRSSRRDARGTSNNERSSLLELEGGCQKRAQRCKQGSEISTNGISPPPLSSSTSSSCGKTDTLESLIRVDMSKIKSTGIPEEEEVFVMKKAKSKASNVIMQLITCGAIFVKDHQSFGVMPNYKSKFSHFKFPSPSMLANSAMLGELECITENSRLMGLRLEDKAYFSGSLLETKKYKEQGTKVMPTIKRSSSFDLDRNCKSPNLKKEDKTLDSAGSNCLPRTLKVSSSKQSKTETMMSPLSDGARQSSAEPECSPSTSRGSSNDGSKRITNLSSAKGSSMRLESFKEEREKLIKIEERLTSGARVIIQSIAPCYDSADSSSS